MLLPFVVLLCFSGFAFASSVSNKTGHRVLLSDADFDRFVLNEPLSTMLLIHSSVPSECPEHNCSKLFEDFKTAALETKGYIRFSSIDFGTKEGKQLVTKKLQVKGSSPPLIFAFKDAPDRVHGRPALIFQNLHRLSSQELKKAGSDLLPAPQKLASMVEYEHIAQKALALKQPLVLLVGSSKNKFAITPQIKAVFSLVRTVANFTVVDATSELGLAFHNQSDSESLFLLAGRNNLGQDVLPSAPLESLQPEMVFDLVLKHFFVAAANKEKNSSKPPPPPTPRVPRHVVVNFTGKLDTMLSELLPTVFYFSTETNLSLCGQLADNFYIQGGGQEALDQMGIYTKVMHCPSTSVCSPLYANKFGVDNHNELFSTYKDALGFARRRFQARESIPQVTGMSISDYFVRGAHLWQQDDISTQRMFFLWISNSKEDEEVPLFVQATAKVTQSFAEFVHLVPPFNDDTLRQIHVDPQTVRFPALIAYVPNLEMERLARQQEEAEALELAKEESKNKKKKKNHQPQQPSSRSARGVNFNIVNMAQDDSEEKKTFALVLEFALAMLSKLDVKRYEQTVLGDLPKSGAPYFFWSPLRDFLHQKKVREGSLLMDAVWVHTDEAFQSNCLSRDICAIALLENEQQEAVFHLVKPKLEALSVSGVGLVMVKGRCQTRVVEKLGSDPTMLPALALYSKRKLGVSLLRGTFTVENIAEWIQQIKRNAVGLQPFVYDAATSLWFESNKEECDHIIVKDSDTKGDDNDDDDELMKEMQREMEREEEEKKRIQKEAIEEAKRLKLQREAEIKANREKQNQKSSASSSSKRTEL